MAIIELRNLAKSYRVYQKKEGLGASVRGLFRREYREVRAVQGIDLDVEQGEFVAFLGPNGAGKTTTLKLLSGVINPTSGTAKVMGYVPWKRENAYRRRFALVMGQKNQLWWDLPAQESFRLHQQIYRISPDKFQSMLDELDELLDVGRLLKQPVRELSLGERMRMELIAALLHSPDVLFLDEPTIGLDVVAQHKVQQFLKYYQERRKITILLTSHYMKDVAALCKRVVIIAGGLIKYDGSLSGIVDSFGKHKIVTLQLADERKANDFERFGHVLDVQPPRVQLRIDRSEVADVLAAILAKHVVDDVAVEDPPLEEVIAQVFSASRRVMFARTVTWWTILRIALEERLVYRGDFALGTLMRFLPIVTQIFLWWAVFESVGGGDPSNADIAGYQFENVIAYFLLTMVSRAFSSMPGLASGIALQIRNGEIKKFLIQPVDMVGFLLLTRVAHKVAYYSVALLPFALVFYLCRGYFVDGWPDATTMAAFALSLTMAFLLGFFLEVSIGLIGFWFLEVTSLLFVYMLLSFFLSGHMFPLDMLPQPWHDLVDLIPLKYLAYFPSAVFLGKVTGPELARGLLIQAAWLLFFILLSRYMFHFGVKRYSGFGG